MLILDIVMLILMLLNLNTGYADTSANFCIKIMSLFLPIRTQNQCKLVSCVQIHLFMSWSLYKMIYNHRTALVKYQLILYKF